MPARSAVHLLCALLSCLAVGLPARAADDDLDSVDPFLREVSVASTRYVAVATSAVAAQATREGHVSRANGMLLAALESGPKSAADYFSVANMLYAVDTARSDELLLKAEALRPDSVAVAYERAMHEHRAGRCRAALPYYRRFLATPYGAAHNPAWAYAVHCDLMVGDDAAAIEDWKHVSWRDHRIGIEESMRTIFSRFDIQAERERLVNQADSADANGVAAAYCDLMEADKYGDIDWWGRGASTALLEFDAAAARTRLKDSPVELAQVDLCHEGVASSPEAFITHAAAAGFWGGETPKLPSASRLAYSLARALTKTKKASTRQILDAWEKPLAARLVATPNDRAALDLLAFLYADTHEHQKLAEVDLRGWKEFHLRRYAESFVVGQLRDSPDAAATANTLRQALAEFPASSVLALMEVQLMANSPEQRRIAIVHAVAAQFPNVAHQGPLGSLNASLEILERLRQSRYAAPTN